jgi:cell division protein ZapE
MSLLDTFRALVASDALEPDPAQATAAADLDALARTLATWRPAGSRIGRLFGRTQPAPRGRYIFGAVGRGKTMLMDLFFEAVPFSPKRRVHFNEFMAEVHEHIGAARKSVPGDPIPFVARKIAEEARLLCFDELHVTDIADAMILGRLFRDLFEAPVVVVATSNVPPDGLYKDGLNRPLFLPFIDLIGDHMEIRELMAAKDFRLDKLVGKPLYFTPADATAKVQMDRMWAQLTGNHAASPLDLQVKGRKLRVPAAAMGVARYSFADLCDQPVGASDFLHIAHTFHTLLLDAIPVLSNAGRDVTRRFINLIDTLYDNRVCLIASAAAEPLQLYAGRELQVLFERTASRLIEMRSESYLSARLDRLHAVVPA